MAYFAQLDGNNRVTWVIVADSLEWCEQNLGGWWKPCVKSGTPKMIAGPNYVWDETLQGFIPPTPFPSWILNEETCLWEAPIPYPADGAFYSWDEETGDWVEIQEPSA